MQIGNVITVQHSADKQLSVSDLDAIKTALEEWGNSTQISKSGASNGTLVLVKGDATVTIALEFSSGEIQAMVVENQ
ncbi:MAG: hypothetical protein J7J87_04635 [Candidatus Diapherotrites archaeon]|nr:hypothetical protein [Candidatus Diapherotrites archaeon]